MLIKKASTGGIRRAGRYGDVLGDLQCFDLEILTKWVRVYA